MVFWLSFRAPPKASELVQTWPRGACGRSGRAARTPLTLPRRWRWPDALSRSWGISQIGPSSARGGASSGGRTHCAAPPMARPAVICRPPAPVGAVRDPGHPSFPFEAIDHAGDRGPIVGEASRQEDLIDARMARDGQKGRVLHRGQVEAARLDFRLEDGDRDLLDPSGQASRHVVAIWPARLRR